MKPVMLRADLHAALQGSTHARENGTAVAFAVCMTRRIDNGERQVMKVKGRVKKVEKVIDTVRDGIN
jgi:hypothetical protein